MNTPINKMVTPGGPLLDPLKLMILTILPPFELYKALEPEI